MTMKTKIMAIFLMGLALDAHATSNVWTIIPASSPHWSVVGCPLEWPHEPDGSNALVRCVTFAEGEIAKATAFLQTGHYSILEGGLKDDPPHVVVTHPDSRTDQWTIFFTKSDLKPYSIERRGKSGRNYLIQIDSRKKLLTNLSTPAFHLHCDPPGTTREFARLVKDRLWYQVAWNDSGHVRAEEVIDWAKRGPIAK